MDAKTSKQLTEDYVEYMINIQRIVDSTISQPSKNDNGDIVKEQGGDGKMHVVNDWKVPVTYTLNFANTTLGDVLKKACGKLVIDNANKTRKLGEAAAKALDGTEVDVKELMTKHKVGQTLDQKVVGLNDSEFEQFMERELKRRGMSE